MTMIVCGFVCACVGERYDVVTVLCARTRAHVCVVYVCVFVCVDYVVDLTRREEGQGDSSPQRCYHRTKQDPCVVIVVDSIQ